ncbi:uncharacterized protein LOC144649250 isoform X1 [Oculina patagonica]
MEASVEGIVNTTKVLAKNNDIYSEKFEEKLNNVSEIEHHLEAANQIADTEQQSNENQGAVAVKNTCTAVVYGDYLKENTNAAGLKKIVENMGIETFPESIQPKGYEIKGYVDEITAQLEEVDNLLKEIENMIRGCCRNQYRISEMERMDLEMKKLEFDGGLEICTDYQKQAEKAMKELNLEIAAYDNSETKAAVIKGVCVTMAAGVGAGAVAGVAGIVSGVTGAATLATEAGAAAVAADSGAGLGALMGAAAGGGGILGGSAYGFYSVDQLTSLLVGAAVSVTGLCLVFRRWAAKRQFCNELLLVYRSYKDLINESQCISDRFKYILRK